MGYDNLKFRLRINKLNLDNKKALITGITGQDGSYLAEFLLEKGYEVHGIKRRSSSFNTERIDHLYQDSHENNPDIKLHYGDLTDSTNLISILQSIKPEEIYNLEAQSNDWFRDWEKKNKRIKFERYRFELNFSPNSQ